MITEITTLAIFHPFLIFCRIGTALAFMPGFGEAYINPRTKLITALAISVISVPILESNLPPIPSNAINLFILIASETFIGLFIGTLMRMIQALIHIAGMIIAFQSSLASALLFDATQGSQGSVIGNFMTITAITLVFISDSHHLILEAIIDSYYLFKVGELPPFADFAELFSKTLSDGFVVAFKISSPLILIGLFIYLAGGLMGRLMPNMQVFFVVIPLQLYLSFFMIMATFSAGMLWYLQFFRETLTIFLSQ